jgi:hypothetical protein
MLTSKDEDIDNWFIFLNRYLLDISFLKKTLNVGIAFGKQDILT